MPTASFRFYGPLNDFLPAVRRQATLVCDVASGAPVEALVDALVSQSSSNALAVRLSVQRYRTL